MEKQIELKSLKGVQTRGAKLGTLPVGAFQVTVERCRTLSTRAGARAIIVEFTVDVIETQSPYTNPETKLSNEVKVGERRQEWFELNGEYGYGEAEWKQFLMAIGATEDTIDEAQTAALSDEQPLLGTKLRFERILQLSRAQKVFIKPWFSPLK